MVVTQKEMHDFKVELNQVLEAIDTRLKALEEAKPKAPARKKAEEKVDNAA